MLNVIDWVVGKINPAAGMRRLRQRVLYDEAVRAYEGASLRDGWKPKRAGASANADHQADGRQLRVRARSLVQNVPYISQGIRSKVGQVVGDGIRPRSTARTERDRKAIDAAYTAMGTLFDADGRLEINALIATAYRTSEVDGEVLIRIRPRRAGDGLPVPVQFQLLEIDWLDSLRNERRGADAIINGIQYDPIGRIQGYWLFDEHPGETFGALGRVRSNVSHFVPAASIIHYFNPERPGQGRGFTGLASVIARTRDLQLYEDAEGARKNTESRYGALVSGSVELLANSPASLDQPGDPAAAARTGDLGMLPSGGLIGVPDGVNITMAEPKAVPGYDAYVKLQLHMIAAGMGVTYEMMTGDVSQVNFSSARVRMLDVRREYEAVQWLHLIPRMLTPMWHAFIDACELAGIIGKPDYAVEWSTPKWDYVNPEQDVKADLAEIGGGLSSLSEKLRRRGYKPDEVFAEIAAEREKLEKLGILDYLLFREKGKLPGDPAQAQAAAETDEKRHAELVRQVGELRAIVDALAARTQDIHVSTGATTVTTPERSVTVEASQHHVHVEPTPVSVHNEVRAGDTVVNVPQAEPPIVNVAPAEVRAVIDVQPATVQLELPSRTTVTEIERDQAGRIKRATQRETT